MAHFYLDESIPDVPDGTAAPETVTIAGAEGRHAVTVARLAVGERVSVGNGRGLVLEGAVTDAAAGAFTIAVASAVTASRPSPAIVLAQALAKGDRDELAVQAATELGVDAVIPWQAQRSISRWEGAKRSKGVQRWDAITREATKQSIRAWSPDVLDPVSTKELAALGTAFRLVVLDPAADVPLSAWQPDDRDVILVVGPEGGIAPDELSRFADAGADIVRLGAGVLRTSTAGPAAIAALNVRLGRW